MDQFLQGNIPLGHMPNEETNSADLLRSANLEVNNWVSF